jgi:hypothetical protein
MSRISGGDQILVKPTNNVYTVLTAVGIVAVIIAYTALWFASVKLTGKGVLPFGS